MVVADPPRRIRGTTRVRGHPALVTSRALPHAQRVILGRSPERAVLDAALEDAQGGQPRALLLSGDAGMGKTALLEVTERRAQSLGFTSVRGTAPEGGREMALALVHDVVRPLHALLDVLPTDERALLDAVAGPGQLQVPRIAEALHDLLRRAAERAPLLVALDNLQWADEDSLAALTLAIGRLLDARILVVGATRPQADPDPRLLRWDRVDVAPLPMDAAAALTQSVLGSEVSLQQARRVAEALARCPLAILECRRLLTPAQRRGEEPLPDPLPLDEKLRHAWGKDVDALDERAARALLTLCVLDTSRADLVGAVLAADGLGLDDLDPAVRAGLVDWSAGTGQVANPLVRAAVLDRTSPSVLRTMHRTAARSAERIGAPPSVLIRHLDRSADAGDEAVAVRLEEQAIRAHNRNQPEVAARGWEAAAHVTTDPQQRARRAIAAARTWLSESTSIDGGGPLLALLTECELDPSDTVWREWLRAEVLAEHDLGASASAALIAANHARTSNPRLVVWLLWNAAATAWAAGDADTGLRAARALDSWCRAPIDIDPHTPPWLAAAILGTALVQHGEVADAAALLDTAIDRSRDWVAACDTPLAELINVVVLDDLLLATGSERDLRLADLALRLADDRGNTLSGIQVIGAWRARRRGDWSLAHALVSDGLSLARAVRASPEELSALSLLVELHALTGDTKGLRQASGDLRLLAGRVGDQRALAHADRAWLLDALAGGRPEQAVAHGEALARTGFLGRGMRDAPLPGRADLVEVHVRCGDSTSARALTDALAELLGPLRDPLAAAVLARCLALTGPASAADDHWQRCLAAHGCAQEPFEEARSRLLLGEHLRRTHQPSQARHQLRRSAATFERLGARPWTTWATRELRATGSAAPETDVPDILAVLTPQERCVAEVVAEGRSNREVAEALFLSPRTVEFHLSSVFRKLGVPGRAALAHLVSQRNAPRS